MAFSTDDARFHPLLPLDQPSDHPAVAGFVAKLEPLLPRGWGASIQLEDPLTRVLEVVGSCGAPVAERAVPLALTPLAEDLTVAPDPRLLERLGTSRARSLPLAAERPFGRLLLVAGSGAAPLTEAAVAAIASCCAEHGNALDRARFHREDEKLSVRLRRAAEGELAERFTAAALGLLPSLVAAAVLGRSGDDTFEVLRVRHRELGLLQGYLRRAVPYRGSHLAAVLGDGQRDDGQQDDAEEPEASAAILERSEGERFEEWRTLAELVDDDRVEHLETAPLERRGRTAGALLLIHGRAGNGNGGGNGNGAPRPGERFTVDRLSQALSLAFDRIRPQRRQASALLYLQELLRAPGRSLAPVLQTVVEEMARSMGADAGVLALIDSDTGRLLLAESIGYESSALPPTLPLDGGGDGGDADGPRSIATHVARTGEPYLARDTRSSPIYLPTDPAVRSEIAVPLRLRGETFGVALASSHAAGFFTDDDVDRFQLFADQVAIAVDNARLLEDLRARREADTARRQRREMGLDTTARATDVEYHFGNLVGDPDGPMGAVYDAIERLAPLDAETVLVFGETGTGKELVSYALHQASGRSKRTMVTTNFAALGGDPNLIQSELFGHEKGSFTGATRRRRGCFETAHRSTLLIDELGDVVPSVQVKLLRVLGRSSRREFSRLGGEEVIETDVRVIAATNKDLLAEVEAGRFREDLYYRLAALVVRLPPLRERPGDVPLLLRHFLARRGADGSTRVEPGVEPLLADQPWPGNIRQLESVLVRSLLLYGDPDRLRVDDVRRALDLEAGASGLGRPAGRGLEPPPDPPPPDWFWTEVWEPWKERRVDPRALRRLLEQLLADNDGFYTRVAERLGVARDDYRRFMDFLANADVKVDYRPYRKG